jgi:Zn-dependent protease with chaperone function
MKKVNLIVMILSSLLAAYLFYGLIKESWTKTDDILLIILLAGAIINSATVEWYRKRERKADKTNSREYSQLPQNYSPNKLAGNPENRKSDLT